MKTTERTKQTRGARRVETDTLKAALALRFATVKAIESSSSSSSSQRPASPIPPRTRQRSIVRFLN